MKVYLDDIRYEPDGWVPVRWPDEAIELLKTGEVDEISLDHDLGDAIYTAPGKKERTGYDVLLWIEQAVVTEGFVPPVIHIHTANAVAKERMEAAREQIYKLANK